MTQLLVVHVKLKMILKLIQKFYPCVNNFIYSKVTTRFGPYSGPSSGRKMNSLRKLYNVIYKIMYIDLKLNKISLSFSIDRLPNF